MKQLEDRFQEKKRMVSRILSRDTFLLFLDLEVKRARRYQNFLCLMLLKIERLAKDAKGGNFQFCHRTLTNLLMEEIRESDIVGSLELNKLMVLLPYADANAGDYVRSRFEDVLRYYDFKNNGYEIRVDQICFPVHGTDTMELIRKALGTDPT